MGGRAWRVFLSLSAPGRPTTPRGHSPESPDSTGTSRVLRSRARSPARGPRLQGPRCLKDGVGPRKVTRSPSGELPRPSPGDIKATSSEGALSYAALVPGLPGSRLAGPEGIRSHDRAYRRVRAPGPISGPITDGEEEHPSSGTQSAESGRLRSASAIYAAPCRSAGYGTGSGGVTRTVRARLPVFFRCFFLATRLWRP